MPSSRVLKSDGQCPGPNLTFKMREATDLSLNPKSSVRSDVSGQSSDDIKDECDTQSNIRNPTYEVRAKGAQTPKAQSPRFEAERCNTEAPSPKSEVKLRSYSCEQQLKIQDLSFSLKSKSRMTRPNLQTKSVGRSPCLNSDRTCRSELSNSTSQVPSRSG